jgi:hypothetical protein
VSTRLVLAAQIRLGLMRRFGDAVVDGIWSRCTRGGWRRLDQRRGGKSGTWDSARSDDDALGDGGVDRIGDNKEEHRSDSVE